MKRGFWDWVYFLSGVWICWLLSEPPPARPPDMIGAFERAYNNPLAGVSGGLTLSPHEAARVRMHLLHVNGDDTIDGVVERLRQPPE